MSAIVGLVIGDTLLFQCYVLVGTRIGVLMFVLGPPFGALLSWIFLGETMAPIELARDGTGARRRAVGDIGARRRA